MENKGQTDKTSQPYTILVAVAGGSPAIVTETYWRLVRKEGLRIDEVRVITTQKGLHAVRESLLNQGRFAECCQECGCTAQFAEEKIAVLQDEAGQPLFDIRDSRENQLAADQICQLIREWTKDEERRIFCSVAGGRKTMSIYLTAAMMLYGRLGDRLFHVLVQPEELEFCRDFFFPCAKQVSYVDRFSQVEKFLSAAEPDAKVDLAEIPFVSVRALVSETDQQTGKAGYLKIVAETQRRLQLRAPNPTLQISKMSPAGAHVPVQINGVPFELTPAAAVFYALLAERQLEKDNDEDGGLELDEISSRELKRLFEQLSGWRYEHISSEANFRTIANWIEQLAKPSEPNLQDFKTSVEQQINRQINIPFKEQGAPQEFLVRNVNRNLRDQETGERKPARYVLEVAPEAIQLLYLPKK